MAFEGKEVENGRIAADLNMGLRRNA